MNKINEMK